MTLALEPQVSHFMGRAKPNSLQTFTNSAESQTIRVSNSVKLLSNIGSIKVKPADSKLKFSITKASMVFRPVSCIKQVTGDEDNDIFADSFDSSIQEKECNPSTGCLQKYPESTVLSSLDFIPSNKSSQDDSSNSTLKNVRRDKSKSANSTLVQTKDSPIAERGSQILETASGTRSVLRTRASSGSVQDSSAPGTGIIQRSYLKKRVTFSPVTQTFMFDRDESQNIA